MSQAGANSSGGGGGGGSIDELTPDVGAPVTPVLGNIFVPGIGGMQTLNGGAGTLQFNNLRWTTQYVVDASAVPGSDAEYTTISAAVAAAAAAGGGQVFVRSGTYVENFSLPANILLTSYDSVPSLFGTALGAVIDGTITIADSGVHLIRNIAIQPSTPIPALDFPAGNVGVIALIETIKIVGDATFAAITGDNTNAQAIIQDSFIFTNGGDYVNVNGAHLLIAGTSFVNFGGPDVSIIITADSQIRLNNCSIQGSISSLLNGSFTITYCDISSTTLQSILLTNTSQLNLSYCTIGSSNAAAAISVASGSQLNISSSSIEANNGTNPEAITLAAGTNAILDFCTLGCSNAFAVTGAGNLRYSIIDFRSTSNALDPALTTSLIVTRPFSTANVTNTMALRGLASFNSANFSVDTTGFVSLNGSGLPWSDRSASAIVSTNSGSFSTVAITLTLPVAPANGDICAFIVDNASALIIQASAGQMIRIAGSVSAPAGTATNTAQGDSVYLVYRSTDTTWLSLSTNGAWVVV